MKKLLIALVAGALTLVMASAQSTLSTDMEETEAQLRASNKQLNQFLRRFNGEEDEQSNRLYEGDKQYRDAGLRKKYLPGLFDASGGLSSDLVKTFIREVSDKKAPRYLDFHSGDWFAEVSTTFSFRGKQETALLYMRIQQQGLGYEWVIEDVAFDPFKERFNKDTSATKQFIHPMSHELDFMTLRKVLAGNPNPEQFTQRSYTPDYLTLFLYELKNGTLKFETVKQVRFHFFSLDGWYFELTNFNRPGYNSGWLVSNLAQITAAEKQVLKAYLYDKD